MWGPRVRGFNYADVLLQAQISNSCIQMKIRNAHTLLNLTMVLNQNRKLKKKKIVWVFHVLVITAVSIILIWLDFILCGWLFLYLFFAWKKPKPMFFPSSFSCPVSVRNSLRFLYFLADEWNPSAFPLLEHMHFKFRRVWSDAFLHTAVVKSASLIHCLPVSSNQSGYSLLLSFPRWTGFFTPF